MKLAQACLLKVGDQIFSTKNVGEIGEIVSAARGIFNMIKIKWISGFCEGSVGDLMAANMFDYEKLGVEVEEAQKKPPPE